MYVHEYISPQLYQNTFYVAATIVGLKKSFKHIYMYGGVIYQSRSDIRVVRPWASSRGAGGGLGTPLDPEIVLTKHRFRAKTH
jgi:hypothetical protein